MDLLADRLHSLSYLVRPARDAGQGLLHPVLCFLHGAEEASPAPIHAALTKYGPLADHASARAGEFLVIAPQMPSAGDSWNRHFGTVREIVLDVRARFGGDPRRTYVTGFGFGANGALDFARLLPDLWAAVWAVDPDRPPRRRIPQPVWLSIGDAARPRTQRFIEGLGLSVPGARARGERHYVDDGGDHAECARRAYGDARVYAWMLGRQADAPDVAAELQAPPQRRSPWYETALRAAQEDQRRSRRG